MADLISLCGAQPRDRRTDKGPHRS